MDKLMDLERAVYDEVKNLPARNALLVALREGREAVRTVELYQAAAQREDELNAANEAKRDEMTATVSALRAEVDRLRGEVAEARKVISLADATYGTMPTDAYACGDDRPVRDALHKWLEKQNALLEPK